MPISVVLPMRNASPWLPALLAALVREWSTGFELIAIDDGSSDGSGDLLKRLCHHWPAERWCLLQGGRRGVSAARNLGVAHSCAPIIAFLDADDRPLPGRLRLPLELLNQTPQLSHVHGGWWRCNASGALEHPVRPWEEGASFSWRGVLDHKTVLPSAWTVRKQALVAVGGFDETLHHAEDVDLLLRLAAAGHQGSWIEQELVRFRLHAGKASDQLRPQLEGLLSVINHHLPAAPAPQEPWMREVRYSTTIRACWQAWHARQPAFALELLQLALQDCPHPLVRRPVHLLDVFARSNARIGAAFARQELMASAFWSQAEALLLAR